MTFKGKDDGNCRGDSGHHDLSCHSLSRHAALEFGHLEFYVHLK